MAYFEKHFTLAEANSLVPWVGSVFRQIHQILHSITGEVKQAAAGAPAPAKTNGYANGYTNGHGAKAVWTSLRREEKMALVNRLLQTLMDRGVVIQDVTRGLIDFPAWRDGDEIMLCYELSDGERIVAWHTLHEGYAGRQPLDDEA